MEKPRLGLVFLIVLIDIIGFSLLLPVLPYYASTFGASPIQIGFLTGLYALCQFFGAPLLARLSDRFGRKPMFLIDIAGSVCGFLVLGFASSLWMLFLARIIAGLVAANVPIAQAYIADVTTSEKRSQAIGLIGAAFGLGFTIGPALGGIMTRTGDYAIPAFVSAGLGVCNFLVIILFLPESVSQERMRSRKNDTHTLRALLDIAEMRRLLSIPFIALMLLFWVGFSLSFALFQQNIALFNKIHLNLTARESGYVFAYIGVLVALMQGVILRPLTARFSDVHLLKASVPLMALSLVLWAFAPNLTVLLIAIAPLSIAASTLITVVNSMLTKAVPASDTGGIMGLSAAVDNSTRFLTAFAGGVLMQRVGTFAPGAIAAVLMLTLFIWSMYRIKPLVADIHSEE
jgi:MFS transporter, DHA1 family, tetracycline resistance protein